MSESPAEGRPVDVDRPEFSRARYDAIVAILSNLREVDGEEAERRTQETLELLDPRWTAERWAEVRDRLAPGRAPRDGGLRDGTVQLVAVFGPVLLTEESRQRAKARFAEAEERRRRHPDALAELRERFGKPRLTAEEEAELDARYEAMVAELERRAGPRDERIQIDAETHRKLMSLAILARSTPSEALADLVEDAYEQREWSEMRFRRRVEARRPGIQATGG